MSQLGKLQRHLGGARRRDDRASARPREPVQEHVVHANGPRALGRERAAARGAAVARVQEHDDPLGLDDVQKLTDKYVALSDSTLAEKEKEIMEL